MIGAEGEVTVPGDAELVVALRSDESPVADGPGEDDIVSLQAPDPAKRSTEKPPLLPGANKQRQPVKRSKRRKADTEAQSW